MELQIKLFVLVFCKLDEYFRLKYDIIHPRKRNQRPTASHAKVAAALWIESPPYQFFNESPHRGVQNSLLSFGISLSAGSGSSMVSIIQIYGKGNSLINPSALVPGFIRVSFLRPLFLGPFLILDGE